MSVVCRGLGGACGVVGCWGGWGGEGGGGVAEQNRVYLEAQGCELHECYAHPHTELEQAYRVQTRQRAVLVRLGKRSHRHLL